MVWYGMVWYPRRACRKAWGTSKRYYSPARLMHVKGLGLRGMFLMCRRASIRVREQEKGSLGEGEPSTLSPLKPSGD